MITGNVKLIMPDAVNDTISAASRAQYPGYVPELIIATSNPETNTDTHDLARIVRAAGVL